MPNNDRAASTRANPERARGLRNTALASFFLGWAPILGKLAYAQGVTPFTLAAMRTLVSATLLWIGYALFRRSRPQISMRGLFGCIAVGTVNGIGSLLYYSGLSRLDASLASFLNNLYLLWVVLFLTASGQAVGWLTVVRLALAMAGAYLLTGTGTGGPDWVGGLLMVASAATYGWHLVLGQWVLADVPSRTATPIILTAMACTVGLARLIQGGPVEAIAAPGWYAILALAATTALSRILMFAGLQRLGGIEAALVGLLELVVSLGLAFLLLQERLTLLQWVGGAILVTGVLLSERESRPARESLEEPPRAPGRRT